MIVRDETKLLLVGGRGGRVHIVDPDMPSFTACNRPDMPEADWYGDGERRQRTLADQRANHNGYLHGVCKTCLKNLRIAS